MLFAITRDLDNRADDILMNLAAAIEVKQVAARVHALWRRHKALERAFAIRGQRHCTCVVGRSKIGGRERLDEV